MRSTVKNIIIAACLSSVLLGCAQDGTSLMTTGSTTAEAAATAPPIDPACLALQNKIALLQDEGVIAKVEQAATGTTSSVMVKRSALSKVAELNKANDEFRARCSTVPQTASQPPAAAQPPALAVTQAAGVQPTQSP